MRLIQQIETAGMGAADDITSHHISRSTLFTAFSFLFKTLHSLHLSPASSEYPRPRSVCASGS